MIYLDNAATTFPKPENVYKAMDIVNREFAINAGRGSYKLAQQASKLISDTKKQIRNLVGVDSGVPVVFSPSITVAINQIVNGLQLREKAVIYVSPYEHNAVARSVHMMAQKKQAIVKQLPLDDDLQIDIEKMKYEFVKEKPDVVFCTHISNVTGYILPIDEIFEESRKYGAINILDSAQSLGLVKVNARSIYADIIAFAGHKTLYGPFGIGGFINVSGIELDEFICGGTGSDSLNLVMPQDKEGKYEASSPNIVAIAGLNAALETINIEDNYLKEKELTDYLVSELKKIKDINILVPKNSERHIGIVSFTHRDLKSDEIGLILDEDYEIAVRTGYHCAPYIHSYLKDEITNGTVRIGIGQFNSSKELDTLIKSLKEI